MNIALFTCSQLPEPDRDEAPLVEALRAEGLSPTLVPWDAPAPPDAVDHASRPESEPRFKLGVIRSTWNYIHHLEAFKRWVANTASLLPLHNPANVVLPNLEKSYLLGLAKRGIPVVPTTIIAAGADVPEPSGLFAQAARIVVKPEVGAGSFATRCFNRDEADDAVAFVRESVAARATIIQPYMAAVEDVGEHAVVVIDGEVSHTVRKSPRFADGEESVSEAREPTNAQRTLAHAALGDRLKDLLYGRVDMVQATDDRWVVMELELTEPSLFLSEYPPALKRLAAAIAQRASTR